MADGTSDMSPAKKSQFEADCIKWRGQLLTGRYAHWCWDWDGLPVDETCDEFSACNCFAEKVIPT